MNVNSWSPDGKHALRLRQLRPRPGDPTLNPHPSPGALPMITRHRSA